MELSKKEFNATEEPLVLIVSYNPETNKTIADTFHYEDMTYWLEKFEKDFPDHIHLSKRNNGSKEWMREQFGLNKLKKELKGE